MTDNFMGVVGFSVGTADPVKGAAPEDASVDWSAAPKLSPVLSIPGPEDIDDGVLRVELISTCRSRLITE